MSTMCIFSEGVMPLRKGDADVSVTQVKKQPSERVHSVESFSLYLE